MSPGRKHELLKKKEAGTTGKKEHWVRGRRIDVVKKGKAVEIQTTVTSEGLLNAAKRLKSSGRKQKVLVVPKPKDVPKAAAALRKVRTSGTARTPDKKRKIHVSLPKQESFWL